MKLRIYSKVLAEAYGCTGENAEQQGLFSGISEEENCFKLKYEALDILFTMMIL